VRRPQEENRDNPVPEGTDVVITGRNAPKELIARADYVNVIEAVKMPKRPASKAGIQY
jgi:ATP:corrinoid adenosyltransferase